MALFPQGFLDDLKAQTDIVAIIGDVTPLKKAGASYKGLCPFHTEKTPSFNVNKDKGFFKCFGCGAGGDAVKFVELHQKVTFPEAVRYLAQIGIKLVGMDSLSIEKFGSDDYASHRALLLAGVVIVEGLDLSEVEPGEYDLACLPLRIAGGDGAPARVVLRTRS